MWIYLPSPWTWEDAACDGGEERMVLRTPLQHLTIRPRRRLTHELAGTVGKDSDHRSLFGSADDERPIRCIMISSAQLEGPLWRKILFLDETWLCQPNLVTKMPFLSMRQFLFAFPLIAQTNERLRTFVRMCPHGIVHGESTCHIGVPVSLYNIGNWETDSSCSCQHRACINLSVELVYVNNGRTLCALTRRFNSVVLRYPEQRYLPIYFTNHKEPDGGALRLYSPRNNKNNKLLNVDLTISEHAHMSIRIWDHINNNNSYSALVRTPEDKIFYSQSMLDGVCSNANVYLVPVTSATVCTTDESKRSSTLPIPTHISHTNLLVYGNLLHIVAWLADQKKDKIFRAWPTRADIDTEGQETFAKDSAFILVSLWPSLPCHRYHGYHVESSTDVFLPFAGFHRTVMFPSLEESGIVWSGDVYQFLLDRNTWCFQKGAPIVNSELALTRIDWSWLNKHYTCQCPKLYSTVCLYHEAAVASHAALPVAPRRPATAPVESIAPDNTSKNEEDEQARLKLLADRIASLVMRPSVLWNEIHNWPVSDIIKLYGSVDCLAGHYKDFLEGCRSTSSSFTIILDRESKEEYYPTRTQIIDILSKLDYLHSKYLFLKFETPILPSRVYKRIYYETQQHKQQRRRRRSAHVENTTNTTVVGEQHTSDIDDDKRECDATTSSCTCETNQGYDIEYIADI